MKLKPYTCILSIAGSDSSAGAGIQADLKTFAALGCYGVSVLTAITAQNTQGVQDVMAIPVSFVKAQLESIFQDIHLAAIKIGMLHNADIIVMLAAYLKGTPLPFILDPVMVAKGGRLLLEKRAVSYLARDLLPLATLITPNIPEAEILCGITIHNYADMERAALLISQMGAQAVLLKGGHLQDKLAKDCLYISATQQLHWYESQRIVTANIHGTGCTLSSAIAAYLGKELPIYNAVLDAKAYLFKALQAGSHWQLGQGHGPVQHFHQFRG